MNELRKIIIYIFTFLITITCFTQVSTAEPVNILQQEITQTACVQDIVDLIDERDYKKALNKLEQVYNLDSCNASFNYEKFNKLFKEYKKILIEEVNNYASKEEYNYALNLLNSKAKYYKNDKNINALIKYNKNQIKNKNLVEYNGDVEHLFTHCLLAFPEMALHPKNPLSADFDRDCLTPYEFKNLLFALYNKNYILVDIESVYEIVNGVATKKTLYLPPEKKPLILSFDDVVYDSKKRNKGMVDRLILDRNKNIATYTAKQTIAKRVNSENEFIPILETFIKNHPDFSHNEARGVICLTGYDGILGYRTQKNNASRRYEMQKVMPIITKLKNLGWKFACHSYSHYHMKNVSDAEFANDISSWQNEVEPLIGKTKIYIYPYGEWEVVDANGKISNKHQMLLDAGFELFCGVGAKIFFGYVPIGTYDKHSLFMDRKPIDGRTLRTHQAYYKHLFNCEEIYDHVRRNVPFRA